MPLAAGLVDPSIDAEVDVAHQPGLAQEAGVGVDDLHHVRVVTAQAELTGAVVGDQRTRWV